jgi:hypothetical protein
MNIKLTFLGIFLCLITFVSALELDSQSQISGVDIVLPQLPGFNNSTASVNNSEYCGGVLCTLYLLKSGGMMTGNINFNDGSANNLPNYDSNTNFDFFPQNQFTIGLRIDSDGTNPVISGLGSDYVRFGDNLELNQNNITDIDIVNTTILTTRELLGRGQITSPNDAIFFRKGGHLNDGGWLQTLGSSMILAYSDTSNFNSKLQLQDNFASLVVASGFGVSNSISLNGTRTTLSNKLFVGDYISTPEAYFTGTSASRGSVDQANIFGDSLLIDSDADGDGGGFTSIYSGDNTQVHFSSSSIALNGGTGGGQTATLSMQSGKTAIVNGNNIFTLNIKGLDSLARTGAYIKADASNTWGTNANDAPTRLEFYTQSDGTGSTLGTPAITIDSNQALVTHNNLQIGTGGPIINSSGDDLFFGANNATFSGDVVAERFIDLSWYWNETLGKAVDYFQGNITTDDDLHEFEKVLVLFPDYTRPVNISTTYLDCNAFGICTNKTSIKVTYPHKIPKYGRGISEALGKYEKGFSEILGASYPTTINGESAIRVENLIANNIYTNSETIDLNIDYKFRFNRTELSNKLTHPATQINILEDGTSIENLNMEDRIVNLEGYIALSELCRYNSISFSEFNSCMDNNG